MQSILDVVKLTAQFVARNGRQFLTNLMNREQRNYQFDFLRPQHSLFQYFTKLLEQYTKVLIPPKDLMKKLNEEKHEKKVLERVKYRVAWIKHQEEKRKKEEEATERERVSYARIDWHNFVVVETVDYQPWEAGHFPPPTNPTEVGARVLMQRRVESNPAPPKPKISATTIGDDESDESDEEETENRGGRGGANTQVEDMDEESSSEDEDQAIGAPAPRAIGKPVVAVDAAPAVQQPPALPTLGNVIVKKYDPKTAHTSKVKTDSEEYLVSPITGERVPASKVQEHMRIGLLDPRWVEERDKQITKKAQEDAVFAAGGSIENSLKDLASRRTDIFGVGEDAALEAGIGKKMGEEDKRPDERVTWDGHSSSAEAAARQARANISLDEQIQQIHRTKGLLGSEDKPGIGPKSSEPSIHTPSNPAQPPTMMQPRPPIPVPQPLNAAPVPVAPPSGVPAMSVNLLPVRAPVPPPGASMMLGAPPGASPFFLPPAPGTQPPTPQIPQFAASMVPRPPGVPGIIPAQPGLPGPPGVGMNQDELDEPAAKRARGEDSLINELEFLNMYGGGLVTFSVLVPAATDKPEWKLNGQMIQMTLPLSDQVSVIKGKLHEETGMPTGKQKLQMDTLFFKDSNTLAYYNISPGTVVNLQIKERGGRKK